MATTVFASVTDIQSWIQSDKIQVDDANSDKQNIEATRIIKGQLVGFFEPLVMESWVDPDNTPELIRGIAGRLTAAFMHAVIYAEESDRTISAYSQWLYTEALGMITQIEAGTLIVVDDNGIPIDTTGSGLLTFFPDDSATAPAFTVDQFFA
jgi:hypothetical protein